MNIVQRETQGVPIVAIEGRLDAVTAAELETVLEKSPAGSLVLNMAELEYISSAGLRVILAAAKRQKGGNGDLHIAAPVDAVRKVFEVSGFDSIFSIFESEEDAALAVKGN